MLCLACSFSRSLTGPLDKGYELFHPAKQIPSRLGEAMRVGSRKNGGNNDPVHVKVRAGDARPEGKRASKRVAGVENDSDEK